MLKGILNLAAIFYILIVVLPTVLVALRAISGFRCFPQANLHADLNIARTKNGSHCTV
jgi:hypothetical protein